MSSTYKTGEEHMLAFSLPEEDLKRINGELDKLFPDNTVVQNFDVSAQLSCYNDLQEHEKSAFLLFWRAMEACEFELAWSIISKLYTSKTMKGASKGPLALACEHCAENDTPLASILSQATPLTRIAVDDWAFYLAIAHIKMGVDQPVQAVPWVQLAQRIPHRHKMMVFNTMHRINTILQKNVFESKRVLPRLLADPESIISTFRDADTIREVVPGMLQRLKEKPSEMQTLREENRLFQRFVSRAEVRYYTNQWQILPQPQAQPASDFSKLPDTVYRAMATVVDWSLYLKLASTCKLLHNRLNHPNVWLHVLDKKWNLDVTVFDAEVPKNPVEIVQKIHALTQLNRTEMPYNLVTSIPMIESSMLAKRSIMTRSPNISACEITATVFNTLIMADRTGDLVAHLIENCAILDFLLQVVRCHTDLENDVPQLALACFTSLFLRSRRTCALVSRFLPPPLAMIFSLTKALPIEDIPKYLGLATAACSSYALYPGAHTIPVPKVDADGGLTYLENLDIFKTREEDFQPAVVDPQYSYKGALVESKTDQWGKTGETKEPPIAKTHYNLDNIEYTSQDNPIGEMLANGSMLVELGDEDEDNVLDARLKETAREMAVMRALSNNEDDDFHDAKIAEIEEAEERGESYKEDAEIEFGVAEDPFGAEVQRRQAEQLRERFSTSNGEWQLFLTFIGSQPVLHRGILNMTLEAPDEEAVGEDAEEAPIAEATGFWTVGAAETYESIKESARNGQEAYGSADDAKHAASLYARDWWKQTHAFSLENGALNLANGIFKADIVRESADTGAAAAPSKKKAARGKKKKPFQENWTVNGDAFEFGFMGALVSEVEGQAIPIGGFLLLKSDKLAGQGGRMQLTEDEAFERLAHLPVQYGPNTSAVLYMPPFTPEEQATHTLEEFSDMRDQIASSGAIFAACASNALPMVHMNTTCLIGSQDDDSMLDALFFPDPVHEDPLGPWTTYRREFAAQCLRDTNFVRGSLTSYCETELRRDLEFIRGLSIPLIKVLPHVFIPRFATVNFRPSDKMSDNLTEENWNTALALFYKWATRLHFFEFPGISPLGGLQFMTFMMTMMDLENQEMAEDE